MSERSTSHIRIESKHLATLCRQALAGRSIYQEHLKRNQEHLKRKAIEKQRKRWLKGNPGFFRRLFRMPAPPMPSDEWFWALACETTFAGLWQYEQAGREACHIADCLLVACQHATHVNVSTDDLEEITTLGSWATVESDERGPYRTTPSWSPTPEPVP